MFDDGELVDGEPVVVVGLVEVNEPNEVIDAALVALVGDGDAVGEEFVEAAVVFDQVLAFAADDLAQGFIDRVGGNLGIEAGEGSAEAICEDDVAVAVAFSGEFTRGDFAAVAAGVAESVEVVEGGGFDFGFGHAVVGHGDVGREDGETADIPMSVFPLR